MTRRLRAVATAALVQARQLHSLRHGGGTNLVTAVALIRCTHTGTAAAFIWSRQMNSFGHGGNSSATPLRRLYLFGHGGGSH